MAKVHFGPFYAIKYIGKKPKELHTSLARPKPILRKGDIVIVDKKTSFNATTRGFGEFIAVSEIEFLKSDVECLKKIQALSEKVNAFEAHNNELFAKLVEATKERDELKAEIEDIKSKNAPGIDGL